MCSFGSVMLLWFIMFLVSLLWCLHIWRCYLPQTLWAGFSNKTPSPEWRGLQKHSLVCCGIMSNGMKVCVQVGHQQQVHLVLQPATSTHTAVGARARSRDWGRMGVDTWQPHCFQEPGHHQRQYLDWLLWGRGQALAVCKGKNCENHRGETAGSPW